MNQISFSAFAAIPSTRAGVNPKVVGGPSTAGGPPACIQCLFPQLPFGGVLLDAGGRNASRIRPDYRFFSFGSDLDHGAHMDAPYYVPAGGHSSFTLAGSYGGSCIKADGWGFRE